MTKLNKSQLKIALDNLIYENTNNEVSGDDVNETLTSFIDSLASLEDTNIFELKQKYKTTISFDDPLDIVNKSYVDLQIADNYSYKGQIEFPSDFPTTGSVELGNWYSIIADVTDSDPTKTNTGLSFFNGDEIYWDGSTWQDYANAPKVEYVTIGINGDYPANDITDGLEQALADGHRVFNVISDFQLFANITIPIDETITIYLYTYSLTAGSYKFIIGETSILNIKGNSNEDFTNSGLITFVYSSNNLLFDTIYENVNVNNIKIINNSTSANCRIADRGNFEKVYLKIPNYDSCGLGITTTRFLGILKDSIVEGSGTSCNNIILTSKNTIYSIENNTFTGLYGSVLGNFSSKYCFYNSVSDTLIWISDYQIKFKDLTNKVTLRDILQVSMCDCKSLLYYDDNCIVSDCNVTDFTTSASCNNLKATNISTTGNIINNGIGNTLKNITCVDFTNSGTATDTYLENINYSGTYTDDGTDTLLIQPDVIDLISGGDYKINGVSILSGLAVTVGVGGEYVDFQEAWDNGKYKTKVVGEVTLTRNQICPDNVSCEIYSDKTINIDTNSYNFNVNSNLKRLSIWEAKFNNIVLNNLSFLHSNNFNNVFTYNCDFQVNIGHLGVLGGYYYLNPKLIFNTTDLNRTLLGSTPETNLVVKGVLDIVYNYQAYYVLYLNYYEGNVIDIDTIRVSGLTGASYGCLLFSFGGKTCNVKNIIYDGSEDGTIRILGGTFDKISNISANTLTLKFDSGSSKSVINECLVDTITINADNKTINNATISGNITITGDNNQIKSSVIGGTITNNGTYTKISQIECDVFTNSVSADYLDILQSTYITSKSDAGTNTQNWTSLYQKI